MTGRRGLQGTPYGPQGVNFFSPQGRATVAVTSTNPIVATTSTYGTNYLIGVTGPSGPTGISGIPGGNGTTTGYITNVTLPATMVSTDAGAYWVFTNYIGSTIQLNLSNGTAVYKGNGAATTVYIGSSLALAYSGTGTSYIVL
jgi:hypothetical protein